MSLDSTAPHSGISETQGVHHDQPHSDGYSAGGSMGVKVFLWAGWALAAAFILGTMVLYLPGFMATSPDTEPLPPAPAAVSSAPASAATSPGGLPAGPASEPATSPAAAATP
jgi:hypothetical protein